ncbi:FecR domain-containing protein [Marinobacter sp.]|uniref:FecR domain-containing protein n=1 Tax=Marinobacter sp. TaxID=50741 RepID=UPI00356269D1
MLNLTHNAIHITLAALLAMVIALIPGISMAELSIARGSAPAASQPTETAPEWVYTVQHHDTLASISTSLLRNPANGQRLLAHNGLPRNSTLQAGDALRIPVFWLKRQPEPARVTTVSGNVQHISGSDGRKTPLTEQSLVRVGDEILSGAGSATLVLADGSELRIAPNTRLMFNRLTQYGKTGMVDTRLRLQKGEVHSRVKPVRGGGARFEITTPSAVAAVRGTVFSMQASAFGSSIQVKQGAVDFGKPGQTQRIPVGYGASVGTSGAGNINIRQLPPAPSLHPIGPILHQLPAALTWQQTGTQTYRVDIFEKESGSWIQSREISGNQFPINQLDNGQYEIHLAALDQRGIAGLPAIASVDVELLASPPTLITPTNGESVNDDMPEFHWQLNGSNELARVEVAENENFQKLITTSEWAPENSALPSRSLSPGRYFWRVVTEAGGKSIAASEVRELIVNGTLTPVRIINVNYLDSQVRVFWERADTTEKYRLQLSEEPSFNNIIKEADIADTAASLRLIPGKRYFVRVKALSDGPLASRWGPGRELYLE